jgi:hypothetical protein
MNKEKIGLGIVTYNSESYFESLYKSLDLNVLDEVVVVNGGNEYEGRYECEWIQHKENKYPAASRNDCIQYLIGKGCDHIFLCEDDMIIKDNKIYQKYIDASEETGLKYFSYVSISAGAGERHKRTPRLTVKYSDDVAISFYGNMCNEFTYHHRSCFEISGLYDVRFRDPFDVDMAYRESQTYYCSPFWWFADIVDSDDYIKNNPVAVSRLQSSSRSDGSREQRIAEQWDLFFRKHGVYVNQITQCTKEEVLDKLRHIKGRLKKA